jgi:translation initiation factor IF-2
MSETKAKKQRIYKFASEYNLSAENLIEFLKSKGYEIKSHMSLLTDEMLNDIQSHYKKDIEKAEQHYKKIAEFQKKRAEKSDRDQKDLKIPESIEEEMDIKEIVISDAPKEEITVETELADEKSETEIVQESTPIKAEADAEIPQTEKDIETPDKTTKGESEKFVSPAQAELGKRKGLKVVGKIDLPDKKKKEKVVKEIAPETEDKPKAEGETADALKKEKTPNEEKSS